MWLNSGYYYYGCCGYTVVLVLYLIHGPKDIVNKNIFAWTIHKYE